MSVVGAGTKLLYIEGIGSRARSSHPLRHIKTAVTGLVPQQSDSENSGWLAMS